MPMRYATAEDVYALLRIDPDEPTQAEEVERLDRIENGLADNFDHEVGTSFGQTPVAETRTVLASGSWWGGDFFGYPIETAFYEIRWSARDDRTMVLPTRVRSVSAIRTGGDWTGTVWEDDELVPVTAYRLVYPDNQAYWGIAHLTGIWSGIYRITGIWSDQVQQGVPNDVREALTFAVCDQYRIQKASPVQQIGPDQAGISIRNPWNNPLVKMAIERHRVVDLIV